MSNVCVWCGGDAGYQECCSGGCFRRLETLREDHKRCATCPCIQCDPSGKDPFGVVALKRRNEELENQLAILRNNDPSRMLAMKCDDQQKRIEELEKRIE